MQRSSYTFTLTPPQQEALKELLQTGNYRPLTVPYTSVAAEGPDFNVSLYTSGKCVVQGKGAHDWVTFTLEPFVLQQAKVGYEDVLAPELSQPHMGIDESGKGDFFGPMVIAAAYVDERIVPVFREMNVRDSKSISSDKKAEELADAIIKVLGKRFTLVTIGPRAYNRLYSKMGNVNRILAWGHARAIENLLEAVPDCPRAIADQFGPKREIERALMNKGQSIALVQRPKAESDPAVAAASIIARAGFLRALRRMREQYGVDIPKGASEQVKESALKLVERKGPQVLLDTAKCHFRTTDLVLERAGFKRADLGPEGAAMSKPRRGTTNGHE
jgi:ribonuclease HIII